MDITWAKFGFSVQKQCDNNSSQESKWSPNILCSSNVKVIHLIKKQNLEFVVAIQFRPIFKKNEQNQCVNFLHNTIILIFLKNRYDLNSNTNIVILSIFRGLLWFWKSISGSTNLRGFVENLGKDWHHMQQTYIQKSQTHTIFIKNGSISFRNLTWPKHLILACAVLMFY